MVVAGDHANNDMAGDDDDSWKSQFEASGAFDSIDCQIGGACEIADVQKIYVNHTADAIANADLADTSAADENKTSDVQSAALADGTYTAAFNTDSSMFHVNEANDGQGTLTVKDGKMTIHISLASKNIVNLFVGTAEDAAERWCGAFRADNRHCQVCRWYRGRSIWHFDVPVEALDQEFDLAILGKKGKWYDHKVSDGRCQSGGRIRKKQCRKKERLWSRKIVKTEIKQELGLLCIMLLLVILTGCGASDTKEALKDGSYTVYVKLLGGNGQGICSLARFCFCRRWTGVCANRIQQ